MLKAHKYRLYPTLEQKVLIDKTIGICRLVYNLALETKIRAWESARINLSAYDVQAQLKDLQAEYKWIKEVDSQAVRASIRSIDVAFSNFFRGAGYPRFKSKKSRNSFRCPNNTREINWEKNTLTIPKIRNIPIVLSKRFTGQIRTITISRTAAGRYFASILVEDGIKYQALPPVCPESTIGIDLGIKSFVVTSSGQFFEPNQKLKRSLDRLRYLQRQADRKKRGSENQKKSYHRIALLHEKILNQRGDYIHKTTTKIVRDSQATSFVVEDLGVANMMKNVRLSRSIMDASFGEFKLQMQHKCQWYGKTLIFINRFAPSSKRCYSCGEINNSLTLADRTWTCGCGANHDRDENAAKNIKHFGLLKYSRQGMSVAPVELRPKGRTKKQESIAKERRWAKS